MAVLLSDKEKYYIWGQKRSVHNSMKGIMFHLIILRILQTVNSKHTECHCDLWNQQIYLQQFCRKFIMK